MCSVTSVCKHRYLKTSYCYHFRLYVCWCETIVNYTFATFLATCLERNKCPHSSNDFFDIFINLELTFEQKLSKTLFSCFFFSLLDLGTPTYKSNPKRQQKIWWGSSSKYWFVITRNGWIQFDMSDLDSKSLIGCHDSGQSTQFSVTLLFVYYVTPRHN